MMNNNKISVIIHTYNNEDIITDCLESVKDFDEIVICDMYSTDRTLEIAQKYNCKIIMHEYLGWADPARDFANSQASNDWILVLDSDERITSDFRDWCYEFIKDPGEYTIVNIPKLEYCWDRPLEMLYKKGDSRFFNKKYNTRPPYVHSSPITHKGKKYTIDRKCRNLAMIHYHTNKFYDWASAANKYTNYEVDKIISLDDGKKYNIYLELWKCFWVIIEKFTIEKGYKDGIRGIFMSIMCGIYKFFTLVKYWEYLENLKKSDNSIKKSNTDAHLQKELASVAD